jgi:hypothetical protein
MKIPENVWRGYLKYGGWGNLENKRRRRNRRRKISSIEGTKMKITEESKRGIAGDRWK